LRNNQPDLKLKGLSYFYPYLLGGEPVRCSEGLICINTIRVDLECLSTMSRKIAIEVEKERGIWYPNEPA
jgi:hypothetical protein